MKQAIVFFSKDNNTREGAKIIGEAIGASITELKEAKKGNFVQALLNKSTPLEGNPWQALKGCERVILMTPIWASHGTPAINAFLNGCDLSGKEVIIITFQQFEDLRNSDKVHAFISERVEENGGQVLKTFALRGGKLGHFAGSKFIYDQVQIVLEDASIKA